MKKSSKTKVKVLVLALALLLCLALSIGVAGAWYQANRTATGTLNMDTGIKIEYTGFHQEVADSDTIWQKDDVEFNLFSTTSVVPGTEIVLEPNTTINAATGSVDFYARFKLDYKFYTDLAGTAEATGINPTDVLVPSADFINSAWVESGDGFYYFATGTTLNALTPGGTPAAFFADGAKYTINTNIGGEGFGYQVDADTTIVRADVILTLEVAQVGTPWSINGTGGSNEPENSVVVEDLSTNVLQDTSGNAVIGDVVEGTKYQIVDSSNNGLKYTFTLNEPTTLNASVLSSGVSNLSSVVVDPSDVDGTATVVGYTGEITDVVIPDYVVINGKTYKVTEIGQQAFMSCKSMVNLTIGNCIDTIANMAFMFCSGLTEIYIPDNVTKIGSSFGMCTNLINVTIGKGITNIGNSAFSSCNKLVNVVIEGAVSSIGDSAFDACNSLENINIPEGVIDIGAQAFDGCRALKSITLPNSVVSIGSYCFSGCRSLEQFTFGSSINSIGFGSFEGCTVLTYLTINATVPPVEAGIDSSSIKTIYVPSEAVDAYKAYSTWGSYNIQPIA